MSRRFDNGSHNFLKPNCWIVIVAADYGLRRLSFEAIGNLLNRPTLARHCFGNQTFRNSVQFGLAISVVTHDGYA